MINPIFPTMHVIDYKIPQRNWVQRSVSWYNNKIPPIIHKIISIAVYVFATLASFTLIGALLWIPICKFRDLSYRISFKDAAAKFQSNLQDKIKSGEITPPKEHSVELKSSTFALNHLHQFAIKDGILWYMSRIGATPKSWEPLYVDGQEFINGKLTGTVLKKVTADGANLDVVDDKNAVHYRKVLIETRGNEDIFKTQKGNKILRKKYKSHLQYYQHIEDLKKCDESTYVAIDKTKKINWKTHWFSFPIANRILNIFSGGTLYSTGSMSHRGRFTEYYNDADGKKHESDVGITTLYENIVNRIRKHDPWAPLWSKVYINFPETPTTCFKAEITDSSASTIMALGYQTDASTKKSTLKILTCLCDIDTSGGNPGINYTYQSEEPSLKANKKTRVLEDIVENEGWTEHPLPQEAKMFHKQISILQTGLGHNAREIRVAAEHQNGRTGFFKKSIAPGSAWTFVPYEHVETDQPLSVEKSDIPFVSTVHAYKGKTIDTKTQKNVEVTLENYGQHAYHSILNYKIGDKTYKLGLHKRHGIGAFLGIKHEVIDLVIPRNQGEEELVKAFGGRRVLRVNINALEKNGKKFLTINPTGKHPFLPPLELDC